MRNHWLRWTVPPGISLAVHAVLIAAVAYIGMRISAAPGDADRLPLAELALPAPPQVPEANTDQQSTPPREDQPAPMPTAADRTHDAVAMQAARLESASASTPDRAPEMDPATLAAMRQAAAESARPQSAAPPSVRFAGVGSRAARTIVYVVDGSGATANSFAYLQTQLVGSIDRLSPTQRFQVVLFREADDLGVSLAPIGGGGLARATPENKQTVAKWLSQTASRGRSNPVEGLTAALELRPDLVLLVTRSIQRTEMGWAQGQRAILHRLNELNPADPVTERRKTVIKTIQLLDEDPTGIMRAIGTLHGDGEDDYRVVTYEQLISPDDFDDTDTRSIGADDEQRIAAAAEIMGTLAGSGTAFSILYTISDDRQRDEAGEAARRVISLVSGLKGEDGRAELLTAQARLLMRRADPGSVEDGVLRGIVDSLGGVMYSDPGTDAQRELTVALALDLLGERTEARSRVTELLSISREMGLDRSSRGQAVLALASMGENPQGSAGADPAWLAGEPPFVTANGSIDAVWGLLLREAMTLARLREGGGEDPAAWEPMIEIRRAAGGDADLSGYIDRRITLLLETAEPAPAPESLPTPVLLAAAEALARTKGGRQRAMGLLFEIASRESEPERAADALWRIGVLGRVINTRGSRAASADALTDLARRYPDHPRAPDAISSAIDAAGDENGEGDDALRQRLELAVDQYPRHPRIDFWRLELAEMLTGFARLDMLDPVTPGTREAVLAGELYEQTVLGMLDEYGDAQVRMGLGVRMREAAQRFGTRSADLWTKRAAMSEAELDPESAIASIDQLISEARDDNEPTMELELMRAQTLLRLGQTRTAFAALRELSARIDATGSRTSTYWQAWALMLEAVAQHGDETDKADARRHIARLQLIDPGLGGSPWRERITGAKETLHSNP